MLDRESRMILDKEWQNDTTVREAMTEYDLERCIVEAQEFMGPGQLATVISANVGDKEYLRDMIRQMQNNYDGRL